MAYHRNIPRFFIFWALYNFTLWMPIWVLFLQERGMTLSQIGVLDAVAGVVMALMEVPSGAVADTYGRKTSMVLGSLLYAAAMFLVTARVLSPLFLVGYLLWGSSTTLVSGADLALLYDSLKAAGREGDYQRLAGRYNAVMQAAQAIAALAGAALAGRFGKDLCFFLTGLCSLVAAAVALTFREPPRDEAGGEGRTGYRQTLAAALRLAAARPEVRYLMLLSPAVSVFGFLATFILLQPWAAAAGMGELAVGVSVFLVRAAGVLGSFWAGPVSQRLGPLRVVWGVPVLVALAYGLAAVVRSPLGAAWFALGSAAVAVVRPVLSDLLNRAIPSAQRATLLSISSLVWTALMAVAEPAVMAVATRAGVFVAVGVNGALVAACALPLLVLWHRTARAEAAAGGTY